jgi:GAF domain-containing protein
MAVPLSVGDRVIGALDLQSVAPDAFDEDAIPTLQAMADQLAVAIENARLFQQAEHHLRELSELSRRNVQQTWAAFLAEAEPEEQRQVFGPESSALMTHRSRVIERVLNSGSVIVSTGLDGRQAFLAAPLVVRDEVIGVIGAEPDDARQWTQEDLQLVQGIAERTAMAVENVRLFIQTRRAAERERLINTIAARLQRAPSLSLLLQAATQELSEALGTESVYAEISMRPGVGRQTARPTSGAEDVVEDIASSRPNLQSTAGAPGEVRGEQ